MDSLTRSATRCLVFIMPLCRSLTDPQPTTAHVGRQGMDREGSDSDLEGARSSVVTRIVRCKELEHRAPDGAAEVEVVRMQRSVSRANGSGWPALDCRDRLPSMTAAR